MGLGSVYWLGRGFRARMLIGKGVLGPYAGWEGGLGPVYWLGRGFRVRILVGKGV